MSTRVAALLLVAALSMSCTSAEQAPARQGAAGSPPATAPPSTTPAVATPADPADVVFTNGQIITMDQANPGAEALAVDGDRIRAVGDRSTIDGFVGDDTRVFDLQGLTVLPGLVDAHSHFFGEGDPAIQDREILSNGITTTAELHVTPDLLDTIQGYADSDELRVRTSVYLIYTDSCGNRQGDWWKQYPPTREPGEMLRIGGVKVFADGGACNGPAVSFSYPDGSSGDLYFTTGDLEAILREIESEGHQAVVHALGDRALATVLDAMERVIAGGPNPLRHRIEHSALVSPELYGRHQEAGAVAVLPGAFRTCFFTEADNSYLYRTPDDYISWEWPWRQLLDSNPETVFAWHADYPSLPATLGETLAGFVTRVQGDCQPLPEMAAGAVTVEEAIEMMTRGSAYALHRDQEVGSLEPGKFADLVVLNQNPMDVDPLELAATEALMTVVGGTVEFCRQGHEALCEVSEADVGPVEECNANAASLAGGAAVTASQSLADGRPEAAVDGDVETDWLSGDPPEQWIEIDLGQLTSVSCIRLLTEQFPQGRTVHRVNGGDHSDPGMELGVLDSVTDTGQWLQIEGDWSIRYLRVTTAQSSSWVAWAEIVVR